MRKSPYFRLALTNIKNNRRLYVPFIMACICCMGMFYIMLALQFDEGLKNVKFNTGVAATLMFGSIIIGIFSTIVILYANSFLMKRRRRELGLFNVLGMEKRHIARIMLWETAITTVLTFVLGIAFGILLSKLMVLILGAVLQFDVQFGFNISLVSIVLSLAVFAVIFVIMLGWNVARVGTSRPVELLSSGSVGDREPKTRWILTTLGVLTLGGGYALALLITKPSMAILMFFVAVILVICGTYCLFTAGSTAVLKMLRANRKYYYKPNHFISVSGMLYRMKRNAAGLANICILSTMVLVMLSTTFCLFYGTDDTVKQQHPREINLTLHNVDEAQTVEFISLMDEVLEQEGIKPENLWACRYIWSVFDLQDGCFREKNGIVNDEEYVSLFLMTAADYSKCSGTQLSVGDGEMAVCLSGQVFEYPEVDFCGEIYSVAAVSDEILLPESLNDEGLTAVLIVSDMEELGRLNTLLKDEYSENTEEKWLSCLYTFDVNTSHEEEEKAYMVTSVAGDHWQQNIIDAMPDKEDTQPYLYYRWSYTALESYRAVYGGLFFLGICLGLSFMMAAALIMYYKQISEGYEDRERFVIMQKVGLSRSEIKSSIKSQVLTVFFLPLGAAAVHMAFAFNMIVIMFRVFGMINVGLFLTCTVVCIAAFSAVYAVIYALTARTYYKIVS